MPKHVVADGECLTSIAARYGFADGKPIMDHPQNADLKEKRPDGHQLHPGDELFVPEPKQKTVRLATGSRHRVTVSVPTRLLRIAFLDGGGEPMAGAKYTLKAGRSERTGSLDGKGIMEQKLPAHLTRAEVTVGEVTRTVLIGHLNPIKDTPDQGATGAQARLPTSALRPAKSTATSAQSPPRPSRRSRPRTGSTSPASWIKPHSRSLWSSMAASPPKQVTGVGDYEVVVGGSPVAFWPLQPGTTLTQAMPPLVCAPNDPSSYNTAFVPVFGIFDVVIRMTDEVKDDQMNEPLLLSQLAGKATLKKSPLVRDANGDVPICFAVDQSKVADGGFWEGVLRLTAPQDVNGAKQNRTIELKLKLKKLAREPRLFVFFAVHKKPKKTYAWIRLKAVDAANGTTPVAGAAVQLKVLRDNFQSGFADINRRVSLTTEAGGYLQYGTERVTIAVPVEWPLILNAEAGGYVPRGHMLRIAEAESKKDQTAPFEPAVPLRMTKSANAKLAGKKVMFDPGHGVVYALSQQRRSQEWFVAHMLGDRVADILVAEHGVARADISWTKTAGFGLIEPANVHAATAPEDGRKRFKLDLSKKRIAAKLAAVRLDEMAALLITQHQGAADSAVAPAEADWNAWLTRQTTAINAIIARVNQGLAGQHRRVRPGSVRWHVASHRYVYTQERMNPPPNTNPIAADPVNLPLALTDWFDLDASALDVLADRSARWSLQCEIGGDAAFQTRARAAMKAAGSLGYMKDKVLRYVNVVAPHAYLTHEMGWGPNERRDYFNNNGGDVDLILTLHENAAAGKGGMILVGRQDPPPDDQVRIAKIFVKYLDPFDQGVRQGGVVMPDPGKGVGLLDLANTRREKYSYFETEFMDAPDPVTASQYRYEEMTTAAFIERVARQIAHGIVEILLDRQSDLDTVTYNTGAKIKNLW